MRSSLVLVNQVMCMSFLGFFVVFQLLFDQCSLTMIKTMNIKRVKSMSSTRLNSSLSRDFRSHLTVVIYLLFAVISCFVYVFRRRGSSPSSASTLVCVSF